MTAPRALAHNKFLVICDSNKAPQAVWTGSTNWTKTGLCTQANNALLVDNPALAQFYLDQWKALAAAGDDTPPRSLRPNATPRNLPRNKATTLWFTPMHGQLDLDQAGEAHRRREGWRPVPDVQSGPARHAAQRHHRTRLSDQSEIQSRTSTYRAWSTRIRARRRIRWFSSIAATASTPTPMSCCPRRSGILKFWQPELLKLPQTHAMVHSKVVVIDPYGDHPVVMTGSHNMGPKASGVNDENLIMIEGNGDLASQYAGKIMEIYSQYRWRASVQAQTASRNGRASPTTTPGRSRIRANPTTSGACANSISGSARRAPRRAWRARRPAAKARHRARQKQTA